ncbi:STAS domain-containing protein [Streptosporangium sp. NBC_01639]|uniref:STAS domain-containing protein n=1 Tax=unclassified Streptosporangium TaxID=2632669 RepID=UPI002DD886D5|nr:STAS domain-containing protein [Streptosporangium sp. NBC_01756]WSC85970.1 STAS domain-containing protein [Streptosporangium sp. NBC_01756]WTD55357.1 STAS domain-containing protein [Streptosporangium sp. NBC_01639]
MALFTISTSLDDTVCVVQASGELDYGNAPVFRDEMTKVWEAEALSVIVVDVTALTFCDSTGVSELIAILRQSRALGARLILAGVHGTLERILTITGLRSAFELSPSVGEALQEM